MDEDRTQPLPPPPPPRPQQGPPVPPYRAGWDADEPFYRRHGLAFAIASGVLAVLLLIGMVGVGTFAVSSLVARAAHSISQDRQVHPGPGNGNGYGHGNGKPGMPGGPGSGAGGMKLGSALARGTVESISASSWTIRTANGTTVTVAITPQTVFGAPGTGGSASDFRRGDQVIVLGKRSGDTITAARIVDIDALRSPATPSPAPATPTPGR